jgi:hypothetical protein
VLVIFLGVPPLLLLIDDSRGGISLRDLAPTPAGTRDGTPDNPGFRPALWLVLEQPDSPRLLWLLLGLELAIITLAVAFLSTSLKCTSIGIECTSRCSSPSPSLS